MPTTTQKACATHVSLCGHTLCKMQGMHHPAHAPADRRINDLMLRAPAHASKALCHDPGCIMVAIARKFGDLHLRVRDGFPNHVLDFLSGHRHDEYPCYDCAC